MINIRRTEKRMLLLLSVIYAGRSTLCVVAETHRKRCNT
jgi:hypothetical protein